MSSLLASLTPQQLRRAATIKEKIQSLENELGRIFGPSLKPVAAVAPKIAAAQKARWAKIKAAKKS